jgi:cell division protein FtsL
MPQMSSPSLTDSFVSPIAFPQNLKDRDFKSHSNNRQTRGLKMSEKKVVSRTVAIALGIICIVLAVGLVGAVANYTSIISGKDNTIASLNSQISSKDSQISSKDSQISSLQTQVNDLINTVNLGKSTVWVYDDTASQPAGYYTYWTSSASYAGYVSVVVHTSTTTNTYVEVIWSAKGVSYDNTITVGTGGTAVFPILPASSIEIRVGNTNLLSGATETVTMTYYY